MAAPADSHASGTLAQDFFCPPSHFKTEGEKEERARDPTAHTEIKLEQASISPNHSSPDSELYWSPWLYSDIVIPDHPSGSSALTCSLPPFPHCPGPLLASDPSPVHRPEMSFAFSTHNSPPFTRQYKQSEPPITEEPRQPKSQKFNHHLWHCSHLSPSKSVLNSATYTISCVLMSRLILSVYFPRFSTRGPQRSSQTQKEGGL